MSSYTPTEEPTLETRERLLRLWQQMLDVCTDPFHPDYPSFGGRGIGVHAAWRYTSTAFCQWATANGYDTDRWLIRLRIEDNFSPDNCWWADGETFRRYLEWIRPMTIYDEVKSFGEWVADPRCKVSMTTFRRRLLQGMDPVEALTTPTATRKHARISLYTPTTIPVGARFGRLTVNGPYQRIVYRVGAYSYRYPCTCDCGTENHIVIADNLLNGEIMSCGCYKREVTRARSTTHGEARPNMPRTRLYKKWKEMIAICRNAKHARYPEYGGRGITVCVEWAADYTAFRDWALKNAYADEKNLHRNNIDGEFSPLNCYWDDTVVPKRNSRTYTAFGEVKTLASWQRDPRCLVNPHTLASRLAKGWDIVPALTTPIQAPHPTGRRKKTDETIAES